jgi:hypothetical protein
MTDDFDDRRVKRRAYSTPLQVMDLRSGEVYTAKTLDYSDTGISFASDGLFQKGTPLYFGILYPPDYFPSRVLEYYKGEVMWRKDFKQSPLSYAYGVQLVSGPGRQETDAGAKKTTEELRHHPRRPFFRSLRFGVEKDTYNGNTKNISASGVFIATDQKLKVGQLLHLNLPLKKGKMVRTVGQIVWLNDEGFGLKFLTTK